MALLSEQYRDLGRDILRIRNADLFMAAQFALFNADLTFGDFKLFRQKFHQMCIGLPVHGRGGDGDFQFVAMQTHQTIAAGFGLNHQPQNQLTVLPERRA